MNQNSIIEIGSKANVILRFKAKTCINGKTYDANEPYLYLKDINVLINYTNFDKTGSSIKNIVANSDIKPRTVSMGGITFSRKLASLLASFESENQNYNYTIFESLIADKPEGELEGTLFLRKDLNPAAEYFVYDSNFNKVGNLTYDADMNAIISPDLKGNSKYLVSFSSVKIGSKLNLNKPSVPYMSLEIQGIGNINKTKKSVLMYFDKVSLNSILEFTFIQDDMINVPLQFHIIDDENNFVIFED